MIGKIRQRKNPTVVIVDDFYENPDEVRAFALSQEFVAHPEYHRGQRTERVYLFDGIKERFEQVIGRRIRNWEQYGVNGCFQSCISTDPIVYHSDIQTYAAVIYLTPNAPPQGGTKILRSIHTKKYKCDGFDSNQVYRHGFYDSTEFETVDNIGNIYNRLVIWDAQCIHAASTYFGNSLESGRLFHIFFFDLEED